MGRYSGAPIIDEMHTINIKSLNEWGYLNADTRKGGTITWRMRGEVTGSINIESELAIGVSALVLSYNSGGEAIRYGVKLITRESNLGLGVYWLFVCPVTGRACRKLYLYNRRFVSRHAIPGALYDRQTWSRYGRALATFFEGDEPPPRRLKRHYRGKPTPRYLQYMRKQRRQMIAAYNIGSVESALSKGK